jgi:hypothetical protein
MNMSDRQSVRWGKDDAGNRVLEVVAVRQLNDNQAKNLLVLLDVRIARASADLEEMYRQRNDLAALLGTGGGGAGRDQAAATPEKGDGS